MIRLFIKPSSVWVLLAIVSGCGKSAAPLPLTYPVTGKVTGRDGRLVQDGFVQFHPESDTTVSTTGPILQDGSYQLTTMRNDLRATGAVAGINSVTVIAPAASESDGHESGEIVHLRTPFTVKEGDNTFDIVLE